MDLDLKEINWATRMLHNGNFYTIVNILILEREKEKMCTYQHDQMIIILIGMQKLDI